MMKMTSVILLLILVFNFTGCEKVQPPTPANQTNSNNNTTEESVVPEPESAAPAASKVDSESQKKQALAKPRKMNTGLRMARDKESAKKLRELLVVGPENGPFTVRVNVDDDGKYTGVGFNNMTITDKITEFIAGLDSNPEWLEIQNCVITDEQVNQFSKLKSLKRLEISGAPITGSCLKILEGFDKLENLNLSSNNYLSLDNLPSLPALTEFSLLDSQSISDESIPKLGILKGLKKLNLFETKISSEGVAKLQKMLPECKIVSGN